MLLSACATAPQDGPSNPSPIAKGDISQTLLKQVTKTLSSDAFEGREPGTVGGTKTLAYLVEQFSAAGLKPGNDNSWFQDVPLVEIAAQNVMPLTISQADGQELSFKHGPQWVGVSYRESPQITLENSELIFVGHGINAPEKGWNDYAGTDVRGKTVIILVNDPDYANEDLSGAFNGKAMTYYGRWTYKYEEAARQGAAAALIIHDTYPASYGWNVVESSWGGPQAYAQSNIAVNNQTRVNGWLHKDTATRILASAGHQLSDLSQAAKKKAFRAIPLGIHASTRFDNSVRTFASKNVIGILPGNERPDEYVLHSAHWDHLGHCKANQAGDDICNGAIDNATGVAALVALARAHAKAGPTARSQIFLAVTAEESGLLGSQYYAANPVYRLGQTVGGMNMDALYMTGPARNVNVIGAGKSALDGFLASALISVGKVATPDASPQAGRYYRSDHFSFAKRGVPMVYFKQGEDLIDGGVEAGVRAHWDYTANAYHGPDDEYDPDWNWDGVIQDLQIYYLLARMLGQSSAWPNWHAGDEFRQTRDETCSANKGGC